jgi:hypothetical protein
MKIHQKLNKNLLIKKKKQYETLLILFLNINIPLGMIRL